MKRPCIIAEIGVNYYDIALRGNFSLLTAAKKMVSECKRAGIRTVKFQTYKSEKLAADYSPAYWDLKEESTTSQKELFSKFDKLGADDYAKIARYCRSIDVEFMSTPFDVESADFIDPLVVRHKIASADITNSPLLQKIASFKKPILLSTGASRLEEITEAVAFLRQCGCEDLTLMHCVLSYPTAAEDANLWKLKALKESFTECALGLSDHTVFAADILISAWLLGASVIEKHFTVDKTIKGNDHYHACDGADCKQLLDKIQFIETVIGTPRKKWLLECERKAEKNARRGCYLKHGVAKGQVVRFEDISCLRPQLHGLSPKKFLICIEKKAVYATNIASGALLVEEDLSW
jgi:sialic acid synthase SpsE